MTDLSFEQILGWINAPLFHIGQTAVTLGGIASALLIVIAAFVIARTLQRLLLDRLSQRIGLSPALAYAISRALHYLIMCLGVIIAVQSLGLNLGSLAVMVGFLGVGIGFGLQNVTSNFISGLILLFERPVGIGDLITVESGQGTLVGTVSQIGLRATHVKTLDNITIIVPNSQFIENHVINWSHGDPTIRIHVPVGVAYGSDVKKVTDVLLQVATDHPEVIAQPAPQVRFLEFGDSSLNFELLAWTNKPEKQFVIRSELNYAIDAGFRSASITIPFPQRDVHVQLTPAIERLASPSSAG
jgi:potassium-dependent mechanosensitive channel